MYSSRFSKVSSTVEGVQKVCYADEFRELPWHYCTSQRAYELLCRLQAIFASGWHGATESGSSTNGGTLAQVLSLAKVLSVSS